MLDIKASKYKKLSKLLDKFEKDKVRGGFHPMLVWYRGAALHVWRVLVHPAFVERADSLQATRAMRPLPRRSSPRRWCASRTGEQLSELPGWQLS